MSADDGEAICQGIVKTLVPTRPQNQLTPRVRGEAKDRIERRKRVRGKTRRGRESDDSKRANKDGASEKEIIAKYN